MPRNPSTGIYSKPAGTTPSTGQVIDPAPWNALTTDLGNEITNSLPRDGSAPMVGPLKGANGTVSAPAFTFGSNAQTGIYLKGGGVLGFTQNGVDVNFDPALVYTEKNDDYTALVSDKGAYFRYTATKTLTLDNSGNLGKDWFITVLADGAFVTVARSSTDLINGATTFLIPDGYEATFVCSGSGFYAEKIAESPFDFFLGCIPAWVSNTSVSFSAGSGVFSGKKHVLPAYTKTMSAFSAGNNGGMLDTGSIGVNKTYFLFGIRNKTTGACDYLASLSLTPAVPSGWELNSGARVGIILTNGSAQIIQFVQEGNQVGIAISAIASGSTNVNPPALVTISSVPFGIQVDALISIFITITNGVGAADVQAGAGPASIIVGGVQVASLTLLAATRLGGADGIDWTNEGLRPVRTNTAAQIVRFASVAGSNNVTWSCGGWIDFSCKRLWA